MGWRLMTDDAGTAPPIGVAVVVALGSTAEPRRLYGLMERASEGWYGSGGELDDLLEADAAGMAGGRHIWWHHVPTWAWRL